MNNDGHRQLIVIIPTYNEGGNVPALMTRLSTALQALNARVIFVDDSTDDTPQIILEQRSTIPVQLIHRSGPERMHGLGGAVVAGFRAAETDHVVVMDGDLQHPPELVPTLAARMQDTNADVVIASRYIEGGHAGGLSGEVRKLVSRVATLVTKAMFPRRLRNCTDPMTGFFALKLSSIDVDALRPEGFKILLEVLARGSKRELLVAEEPFIFGNRLAGESKATFVQGKHFLHQLASLRFGRGSRFAAIGALGGVLNLGVMAYLVGSGMNYLAAAFAATELAIAFNFVLQEQLVFKDLRTGRWQRRLWQSAGFDHVETAIRLPFVWLLVAVGGVPSIVAQALTLAAAFLARFVFKSRVVYRIARTQVDELINEEMEAA